MSAQVTTQIPSQALENVIVQREWKTGKPSVNIISIGESDSESDREKSATRPRTDWTESPPLPFSKPHQDPARPPSTRSLFESVNKQSYDKIAELCFQSQALPIHFMLAAIQIFAFKYTDDSRLGVLALAVEENAVRPRQDDKRDSTILWASKPCGECNERSFVDMLDDIKLYVSAKPSGSCRSIFGVAHAANNANSSGENTGPFSAQMIVSHYHDQGLSTGEPVTSAVYDWPTPDIASNWRISLHIDERPDTGINIRLDYPTGKYEASDVECFFDSFISFLAALMENPRKPLEGIPMCGPKELTRLRKKYWNTQTTENQWEYLAICDKILQWAQKTPDSVAVATSDGDKMTYFQLINRARKVALCLQSHGASPGDRVCLLLKPGINAVTGMLGTVLMRCCFVFLDSDFAPTRLATIIADCGTKVVLIENELQPLVEHLVSLSKVDDVHIVNMSEIRHLGDESAQYEPAMDDAFYMIYTSGSTGTPKGVVLSHGNTQQMLASLDEYYQFTPEDTFLQQSSLAFDLSIVQTFSALCAGAKVCIAVAQLRKDPTALADFMRDDRITVTYFTPTQFALLLESNPHALTECQSYRIAMFAGERLPARLVKAFYDATVPGTVYNTWSPSELVVQTTIHKVEYPNESSINIPIGSPLPNCRHYIVDGALNPLPAGCIGEICVGGAQVGIGYLGRPEENAKSFIQNPLCVPSDRKRNWTKLFRTGDRGRFLRGGALEFHGRIAGDKQIKLRGFRIDLGEIEQALYRSSKDDSGQGIIDIAVVARPIDAEDVRDSASLVDKRQLIAFIIPKRIPQTDIEQSEYVLYLHNSIRPILNHYMMPSGYQLLSEMPTTVGGKADRQRLLHMKLSLVHYSTTSDPYEISDIPVAQQSILMEVIELMKSVVGEERNITPNANFFEVGGQSLLLLKFRSELRKRFGMAPPLQEMFQKCTPLAISEMVFSTQAGAVNPKTTQSNNPGNFIDWSHEVSLEGNLEDLNPPKPPQIERLEISRVLLTGADTFIGVHMLGTILTSKPDTRVFLLGTLKRLEKQDLITEIRKYHLFSERFTLERVLSQVVFLPGSMAASNFGLSEEGFQSLADSIHTVYNFAAEVSLLKTYRALESVNTEAVRTLISLANRNTTGQVPEINHLSTWSIPHMQTWQGGRRTTTDVIKAEESTGYFVPPNNDEHGYLKSRWAAEMILTKAAGRGYPVSIYRSSSVSGSISTNVPAPSLDFVNSMIMQMIRHRLVPDISVPNANSGDFVIDFIPVDVLTHAIYSLSVAVTIPRQLPCIYHLGSSQPLRLDDLPSTIDSIFKEGNRELGQPARIVSLGTWLEVVRKNASDQEQLYWTVIEQYLQYGHIMFALDQSQTISALRAAGWPGESPRIDAAYLRRLWAQVMEAGG
ncbi:hypothetical protein N7501_006659 [Penicillium viridicatum]|nr:hypothetical protein N7501_006659 [Penicillium viridicatum]